MKAKTSNVQLKPELHHKLYQMALDISAIEGTRIGMGEVIERLLRQHQTIAVKK